MKGLYGNSLDEAWYGGYLCDGSKPSTVHFTKADLPPAIDARDEAAFARRRRQPIALLVLPGERVLTWMSTRTVLAIDKSLVGRRSIAIERVAKRNRSGRVYIS